MSSKPSKRSLAEQSIDLLLTDRGKLLEGWREQARNIPRISAQLAVNPPEADFMSAAMRELSDHLFPLLVELRPASAANLDALRLVTLEEPEAFASFCTFEDGSSRVLVTDGMIGLLRLCCDLTSAWYYSIGGRRGWVRSFRQAFQILNVADNEKQVPVLTVCLRWNLIHRRVWGTTATLARESVDEDSVFLTDLYSQLALMFVVAHECAHAILGHTQNDSGDWAAETDADLLALRAVHAFVERASPPGAALHSLVGVRLAFFTADLVERALFVRPPVRHPTAKRRWETVCKRFGDAAAAQQAELMTTGLAEAVRRAIDPRFAVPESWWQTAYSDPHVHRDVHEPGYYENFFLFDRLSFGDPEDPARLLNALAENEGRDILRAAFATREHGLRAGLDNLGVDEYLSELAADQAAPLGVHSLIDLIHRSTVGSSILDSTRRRLAAIAGSTLMGGVERGVL